MENIALQLSSLSDEDLEIFEYQYYLKRNLHSSIHIDLNSRREKQHFDYTQSRFEEKNMRLSATVSCLDFQAFCDKKPLKTIELRDMIVKQKNKEYQHYEEFVINSS